MKLKELITLGEEYNHLADIDVAGVTCDSRIVRQNYVFVCVNGNKTDGHDFAAEAIHHGASVIISQRDIGVKNQIIVENTRQTYAVMCAAFFGNPAKQLKIIGITGTAGKTVTAMMVKKILEKHNYKVGVIGSVKNMVGEDVLPARNTTPDPFELHSLLYIMHKAGCDYVVMEISSHAIDQDRVYGLEFLTCVFTNIGPEHLDYHKSMENYIHTKKKIFHNCVTATINIDDAHAQEIIDATEGDIITYSTIEQNSDFFAKDIVYNPDSVTYELVYKSISGKVRINAPSSFSVYNSTAAIATAVVLGCSFASAVSAVSESEAIVGREEVVPTGLDFTVVIDYAHTPEGLKNITKALSQTKTGKLYTVFGCEGERNKNQRALMGNIASMNSDLIVITADNPRNENLSDIINDILEGVRGTYKEYKVIEDRVQAIEYILRKAKPGDMVLLAGKGHETYQIIGSNTVHLDEREIVKTIAEKIKAERAQ